jgi:hypothetical protein
MSCGRHLLLVFLFVWFAACSAVKVSTKWQISDAPLSMRQWYGLASDAAGGIFVATADGNCSTSPLYVSQNGGVNWTQRIISGCDPKSYYGFYNLAMSRDARYLYLLYSGPPELFISTDLGMTWTSHNISETGMASFSDIDCTADGKSLVVNDWDGEYLYTSSDYGQHWTRITAKNAEMSALNGRDGNYLLTYWNNTVTVSTDFGKSFDDKFYVQNYGMNNFAGIAVSNSGQYMYLLNSCFRGCDMITTAGIYISNDFGATWTKSENASQYNSWYSIAIVTEGKRAIAGIADKPDASHTNGIYYSTDGGVTWIIDPNPPVVNPRNDDYFEDEYLVLGLAGNDDLTRVVAILDDRLYYSTIVYEE